MAERIYLAVDLKSFYASVECVERGLDPLTTNLAVADLSRTEKTICLAVTPSLKAWGISGRARLFEVVQRVREVNAQRLHLNFIWGLTKTISLHIVVISSIFDLRLLQWIISTRNTQKSLRLCVTQSVWQSSPSFGAAKSAPAF